MQSMESSKPVLPVALADERVGAGWRRSRKTARVLAVLCALVAAGIVFGLFNQFNGGSRGEAKPSRELIASIDLSIGNTVLAGERGEAKARADLEAGLLELQAFGLATPAKADADKAQRLKQRHGVTWVVKGKPPTPVSQAFADAYNRVVLAEIERRHGKDAVDRLLQDSGLQRPADRTDRP